MTARDIFIHLRFPFSFLLLPVFGLAAVVLELEVDARFWWVFVVLHLLVYPASNAYNSFFDKDTGPIGGIEKPPAVDSKLLRVSVAMTILSIILAYFFVNVAFGGCILVYNAVSMAYSHPAIRLKKRPILSWLIVSFFQGFWVYFSIILAFEVEISGFSQITATFVPSVLLLGIYPVTQIFQHEQDKANGDHTMSQLLGYQGTMFNALFWLGVGVSLLFFVFDLQIFIKFLIFTLPVSAFALWFTLKVMKSPENANFKNTMIFNLLAALCLNLFYLFKFLRFLE